MLWEWVIESLDLGWSFRASVPGGVKADLRAKGQTRFMSEVDKWGEGLGACGTCAELKGGWQCLNLGIRRKSYVTPCRCKQWPGHAGPWGDYWYSVPYSKSTVTALTSFSWRLIDSLEFPPCCETELEGNKDGCWEASYELLMWSGER